MLRRLALILALIGLPLMAAAQSVEQSIIAQLEAQGFEVVDTRRTFLGRVRIVAQNGDVRRELVFNRHTGEILRDYTVALDSDSGASGPIIFDLEIEDDDGDYEDDSDTEDDSDAADDRADRNEEANDD